MEFWPWQLRDTKEWFHTFGTLIANDELNSLNLEQSYRAGALDGTFFCGADSLELRRSI